MAIGIMSSCQKLERDNPNDRNENNNGHNNCVEYKSYSINSESVHDNIITPGETLRIGINYTANTTYGATIRISTNSPYAECESIAASLSSNDVSMHLPPTYPSSTNGFWVNIKNNAPVGAIITITVSINTSDGNLSENSFNLTVGKAW